MKTFRVEVKEVSSRIVRTQADCANDALDNVRGDYANEIIVLGASDYDDVTFKVIE